MSLPRWPKVTLFDDPDEELRVETMREALQNGTFDPTEPYLGTPSGFATLITDPPVMPRRFDSHGLETDDGSGPFDALKRYAAATQPHEAPSLRDTPASMPMEVRATDEPYLRYDHAFPGPNPKPVPPPPDMPTDGPWGPATMNTKLFRKPTEQQLANKERVSKGIGTIINDSVVQVAGGVSEAVHNTLRAIPGVEELEKYTGYQEPKFAKAETAAGTLVRDTARFLTGFIPAVRAVKLIGLGGAAASTAAAGLSEFFTRNPIEESLSDLFDKHTGLREAAYKHFEKISGLDPNDVPGMRRLENGLVGALVGLGLDLVLSKAVAPMLTFFGLSRHAAVAPEGVIIRVIKGSLHTGVDSAVHGTGSHRDEPHTPGGSEP